MKSAHPSQVCRVEPPKISCPWPGCTKIYRSSDTLSCHISRHQNQPSFKCDHCSLSFYTRNCLNRHLEREHGKGGLKICEFCGHESKTQENLNQHRTKFHNVTPKQYIYGKPPERDTSGAATTIFCEICGKSFRNKSNFQNHFRTRHEKRFYFYCETCGKGYPSRVALQTHQHTEHGMPATEKVAQVISRRCKPDYKCPVKGCKKWIWGITQEKLERHRKKFHGESGTELKFKCRYCAKAFGKEGKLKDHQEGVHENKERLEHVCRECGKAFAIKHYLRIHEIRVHNAEKKIKRVSSASATK